LLGRLDRALERRARQVRVLLPVVEGRVDGELDDVARARLEQIRGVRVHEAGVVGEAVFGDERRRAPCRLPTRTAKALRLDAEARERLERAFEVRARGGFVLVERAEGRVRAVPDLMSGGEDLRDRGGGARRRPARDEQR